MSYELADARVEDLGAEVVEADRVTFTGAAILRGRRRLIGLRASAWRVSRTAGLQFGRLVKGSAQRSFFVDEL